MYIKNKNGMKNFKIGTGGFLFVSLLHLGKNQTETKGTHIPENAGKVTSTTAAMETFAFSDGGLYKLQFVRCVKRLFVLSKPFPSLHFILSCPPSHPLSSKASQIQASSPVSAKLFSASTFFSLSVPNGTEFVRNF
jgi:hypothetical protein